MPSSQLAGDAGVGEVVFETTNDEAAALKLWRETGVRVLPGGYLAQEWDGVNPGETYVRVAMVAPKAETERGIELIRDCLYPRQV